MGLTVLFLFSCKKEEASSPQTGKKQQWIAGSWKQKDVVTAVTVKLAGTGIPAGSSLITLAPMLAQALKNPALAEGILCTRSNVYTFGPDKTYSINGCTELLLPGIGDKGSWQLTIYDAVLQFTSATGQKVPHWINSITGSELRLAATLSVPGVGDLPLSMILQKQ